jgi:hypothetical protein
MTEAKILLLGFRDRKDAKGERTMRQFLATAMAGAALAFVLSVAPSVWAQGSSPQILAVGPTVQGEVTQKFTPAPNAGGYLIAVDGFPYAVPYDFWSSVRLGDEVRFDGVTWTILPVEAAHAQPAPATVSAGSGTAVVAGPSSSAQNEPFQQIRLAVGNDGGHGGGR